jgi:hypothetical protein
MKSLRAILALGILSLSCAAQASHDRDILPPPPKCHHWTDAIFSDRDGKNACGPSVSVPEPATLGLLGIGLIGLAVRRRRK